MRFFTFLWTTLLSVLLVSCTADSTTPVVETKQELATPSFQAVAFPEGFGIHGIDATRHLWFAAVAYPPSVRVARRLTGTVLGSLPAPAGGFGAPVAVRVASDGRVLVLDGVTTPQLAGTAPAVLYEYAVTPTLSGFSATLLASHTLPLIGESSSRSWDNCSTFGLHVKAYLHDS